jgi:hypothetical protein
MGFSARAKEHDLLEAKALGVFQPKHADVIELAGQQSCTRIESRYRNHKDEYAVRLHPAITVVQKYRLHSSVVVRTKFGVVRWVQIQQGAAFRQYFAVEHAAVDGWDSSLPAGGSALCVNLDCGRLSARIFRYFQECSTVARTRIYGAVGLRCKEYGTDVPGFFDW